jgi:hypothetical protein
MSKRPQAVEAASWLTWLLVAGGLVVSVLVVVERRDLAADWSPLHPEESTIRPLSFVPVVVVLYATIAITALVLLTLFRQAQGWARHALSVVDLGLLAGSFAIMRTAPPTSVRCALVVAALITAASLVVLWHPSVGRFLRAASWHERTG